MKPLVNIFTDGACSGNPGPGGWGVILLYNDTERELSGGQAKTTNNRMELTAVIMGLRALKKPCRAVITTDSKYICDAVNQGWVYKWKENGWMRNNKDKALNVDLWEELLGLLETHEVTFNWIKGHAGHPQNERCDKMAVAQSAKYRDA